MTDLSKLSASKLHAVIEKRRAKSSEMNRKFIDAGMWNVRISEIRQMAKTDGEHSTLAKEYVAALDSEQEANSELEQRRRYHGGDKPIKPRFI